MTSAARASTGGNLFLIGYRGSGKTSVAKLIAARLRRPCVELDELIEHDAGMTIREIFEQQGESVFRDFEQRWLAKACESAAQVISAGGGVVLRDANRAVMRDSGRCVWLRAAPRELARRLAADANTTAQRPSLTSQGTIEEIESLLRERTPAYEDMADYIIDTDGRTIDDVARDVVEWYDSRKA